MRTILHAFAALLLSAAAALAQPQPPPPHVTGVAPIVVAPVGPSYFPAVSCPTCATSAAPTIATNAQSGTTYTIAASDVDKIVVLNNAAGVNVTVPQATGSFGAGFYVYIHNRGSGTVTLNPTTSTIGGNAHWYLMRGAGVLIISDGTNYTAYANTGLVNSGLGWSLQKPDGAAANGNVRGGNAIDLQTARSSAAMVASGIGAAIVGGANNTASGQNTVAGGFGNTVSGNTSVAFGSSNTASATADSARGLNNTASGPYSDVSGLGSTDRGNVNVHVYGSNNGGTNPAFPDYAQTETHILSGSGATAAAIRLTGDGAAAGAGTCANLGPETNAAAMFTADVIIYDQGNNSSAVYTIGASLITRSGGVGTVAMAPGNPASVAGPATAAFPTLQAAPSATADTTNGCMNLSFTPPVGNIATFLGVARVRYLYTHN